MITPVQCLEARKLLRWSRDRLAPQCGMSTSTLGLFESGERDLPEDLLAAVQRTLEAAGVEFTAGGEPGVKLRKVMPE